MRVGEPYRGYEGPEQFVEMPAGAGSRAIGDRLVAAGVVRDALVVSRWACTSRDRRAGCRPASTGSIAR